MAKTTLSRMTLTLLTGAFFLSSWLQTARMALSTRMPYLDGGAAPQKPQTSRERFELSQRLDRAAKGQSDKADRRAVNKAWGADGAKMLDLLKQSGR